MENEKLSHLKLILKDKQLVQKLCLDIKEISIIADYFIVLSMDNIHGVNAIAELIEGEMDKVGFTPKHSEGKNSTWVVLDYDDVVVHIFEENERKFYNLEKLWSDAKNVDMN